MCAPYGFKCSACRRSDICLSSDAKRYRQERAEGAQKSHCSDEALVVIASVESKVLWSSSSIHSDEREVA
jgi:hypothetical protein